MKPGTLTYSKRRTAFALYEGTMTRFNSFQTGADIAGYNCDTCGPFIILEKITEINMYEVLTPEGHGFVYGTHL